MYVSVIRHTLPMSRNVFFFFLCQSLWPIETPSLFGMKMFCCHCFFLGVGGRWCVVWRVCARWFSLQVIAEKMKIHSYIHVGKKICIYWMFPKGCTNSKCLYSGIYLIWDPQGWRGARLLNISFVVKQYLYWPKFLQVIFSCVFLYHRWSTIQTLCCHVVTLACSISRNLNSF